MTAFGGAITDPTKIMGSRIGAYIVDSIIALAILFAVVGAIGLHSETQRIETGSITSAQEICSGINNGRTIVDGAPADSRSCRVVGTQAVVSKGNPLTVQLQATGIYWVIIALNYVLLTSLTGASLGKLLFGLRVVRADGTRAGPLPNLIRTIVLVVDAACCAIPGLVSSNNSAGHRRIGDMAAGTYVVHRSAEGRPLSIPGHLSGRGPSAAGAPWQQPGPTVDPFIPDFTTTPSGVDTPVFDQSRNAYVRFDPASGAWFQWHEPSQTWIPAQT